MLIGAEKKVLKKFGEGFRNRSLSPWLDTGMAWGFVFLG
jgi:hypothetical protein